MTRRKLTVRDAGEIFEHWPAGCSIRAIRRSLEASRLIIRKYAAIAEAHGFKPGASPPTEGWRAFLEKVAPETFNPVLGTAMTTELRSFHETIKEALQHTIVMTTWLRMRDKPGIKASYSSFYCYVRKYLPELSEQHTITVRLEDPPPGEDSPLDYGYPGLPQPWAGVPELGKGIEISAVIENVCFFSPFQKIDNSISQRCGHYFEAHFKDVIGDQPVKQGSSRQSSGKGNRYEQQGVDPFSDDGGTDGAGK